VTGEVFVLNAGSGNVSVLSDATDEVVASVPVGSGPSGAAYVPAKDEVFVADGGVSNVTVLAVPPTYTVTFAESGIPPRTLVRDGWTIVLDGSPVRTTSSTLSFPGIPAGTYGLLVTGPSGYRVGLGAFNPNGTLLVSGNTTVPVSFGTGGTLTLTFSEKGLAARQEWCVALDHATSCSTKPTQRFGNLTPTGSSAGYFLSYGYGVVSPLRGQEITATIGRTLAPVKGSLSLTTSASIAYRYVYRYNVTFTEFGAPNGTWSVTLGGTTLSNRTGDPINFSEPNGTYAYKIGAISGYTSLGSPGKASVHGTATSVFVSFASKTPKRGPASSRPFPSEPRSWVPGWGL